MPSRMSSRSLSFKVIVRSFLVVVNGSDLAAGEVLSARQHLHDLVEVVLHVLLDIHVSSFRLSARAFPGQLHFCHID